jgi:hypothetical protein
MSRLMCSETVSPSTRPSQTHWQLTRQEADTISAGVLSICPDWSARVARGEFGDVVGVGAHGWSKLQDMPRDEPLGKPGRTGDAYGIAFVADRKAELVCLRPLMGIGTYDTVAEAVEAMKAHAHAWRH